MAGESARVYPAKVGDGAAVGAGWKILNRQDAKFAKEEGVSARGIEIRIQSFSHFQSLTLADLIIRGFRKSLAGRDALLPGYQRTKNQQAAQGTASCLRD